MAKKLTSSVKKFIWQLQKFPMNEEFRCRINGIIHKYWDSAKVEQDTLIIKNDYVTYTISMRDDKVEYHKYYTSGGSYDNCTFDEAGKIYKCGKNLIAKYCESTITTRYDYQHIETKTSIQCFNEDLREIFKSITIDYKNYNEETGKKGLIQYEDRGYPIEKCNNLTTIKIRRTHNGNLIRIDEISHYVDKQKKYDKKWYSIRRGDENCISSIDDGYIPISEELYMNYMNFKITESELFKHYVKLKC